jgi:ketosteroid isomerase-like protein
MEIAAQGGVVSTVLMHLKNGKISDATACFAEKFEFKDPGDWTGVQEQGALGGILQKTRELYPDSSLQTDTLFVSGDHVITEWTLETTLMEPFYGRLSRKVPVSMHGASIVRIDDGKITDWSDYYDGLTSRRTALASYFTEWVEL